jgi:hypothetical protein
VVLGLLLDCFAKSVSGMLGIHQLAAKMFLSHLFEP